MGEFDDYLTFRQGSSDVRVLTRIDKELLVDLEGLSAYPNFLNSTTPLSTFLSLTLEERREVARSHGVLDLRTDLSRDYSQDLVFFEGSGGGSSSFTVLQHLSVSDSVASTIQNFAKGLPSRYLAAHVRATDYRADVEDFLKRLTRIRRRTPVYLATDNQDVYVRAKGSKLADRLLGAPPELGLEPGQPRHLKGNFESTADVRRATEQVFRDLFALSGASRLYYPFLDPSTTGHDFPKASGFSRLARYLAENPDVHSTFFRCPRPTPPRWPAARILAPVRPRFVFWKRRPFRYWPDSLRLKGKLRALKEHWWSS
jgi:hypothetical protein